MILSAKHGLIPPGEQIAPYETSISDLAESELNDLAKHVYGELSEWIHWDRKPDEIHVLAGKRYIEPLQERGAFDVDTVGRDSVEWQDTQTGVFTRFSTIPRWKSPRTHVRQYEPAVRFPLQEADLGGIGEQMSWLNEQSTPVAVTDGGHCVEPSASRDGSEQTYCAACH